MLLDEHSGGQRLDGVVVENRYGRLQHDRTSVQLWGGQVHGRAGDPHAVIKRLLLRVQAGKRRQERRVDVQNAIGNASSSGAPTSRMKPARHTRPTRRDRRASTIARSYSSRSA
jgi:hypothetical protein